MQVNFFDIGTPEQFKELLSKKSEAHFSIISGHGSEKGLLFPELAPDLAAKQTFNEALDAPTLQSFAQLGGRVVFNTSCFSGVLAEGFLNSGCHNYIGAKDYVESSAALVFTEVLFYQLKNGTSVSAAVEKARSIDNETALFKLYE